MAAHRYSGRPGELVPLPGHRMTHKSQPPAWWRSLLLPLMWHLLPGCWLWHPRALMNTRWGRCPHPAVIERNEDTLGCRVQPLLGQFMQRRVEANKRPQGAARQCNNILAHLCRPSQIDRADIVKGEDGR